MTKLLIITRIDDTHAHAVKEALEAQHHHVDLWYTAEYPTKLSYSYSITNQSCTALIIGENWQANQHYDVIWYRRPAAPTLPEYLHPNDIENVKKENTAFTQSIWQVIYPDAKWINPISASMKANSKLLQLKLAKIANLNIPNTLISNDPILVKDNIKNNKLIFKTLHPMSWIQHDELRLTYTTEIQLNDLPSDKLLRCTPGIYQEIIPKKHELRITYFGDKYIAVKIDSQQLDAAKLDWRAAPTKILPLEQVNLPDTIDQACQAIMKNLGIVFGCFDFIVTPDNDYYFLEVNEQGQFLWIEEVNPNIPMLTTFCEFITKQ